MAESIVYRIKSLAEQKGTTLQELASDLGFGVNSIYKWDTNTPRVDKVKLVADKLGVTVDALLNENVCS